MGGEGKQHLVSSNQWKIRSNVVSLHGWKKMPWIQFLNGSTKGPTLFSFNAWRMQKVLLFIKSVEGEGTRFLRSIDGRDAT